MNKKKLAISLSKLEKFKQPDYKLEQYQTPSEIAAEALWIAYMNNDIQDKIIADFGCGNGIFGIGSLLLGAKKVYFVDIDEKMILLVKKNLAKLDLKDNVIFFNKDINQFNFKVDTVIQNPPFGVKKKHMDKNFLIKAFSVSKKIYSFHKTSTESFIKKFSKDNNFVSKKLNTYKFPLEKTMDYHEKFKDFTDVDLWLFSKDF